ncbi:hypothetical protein DM02DRAFT_365482 [Periconia macrospinosa]|uniref:Uncharacterized protein n=1 Tax=Periconia macrospinosa TaxID=97972 RepID=A0A2V1DSL2_9PLEO|nr:hypothetical protein DM02DRAFT_365482 [Periconia macrospinosa]
MQRRDPSSLKRAYVIKPGNLNRLRHSPLFVSHVWIKPPDIDVSKDPAPITLYGGEMSGNVPAAGELKGSAVRHAHELETKECTDPAELGGKDTKGGKLKI